MSNSKQMENWKPRATKSRRRLAALVLLTCCACAGRYVRIAEKGLTCAEAHHIAISAVQRMGYTVTEAKKPAPGAPGVITGSRTDGGSQQVVLVQVFCTTLGVEVEAKGETGGLAQLNFSSEFKRTFEAAVASRPPTRKAAESGVDVLLTVERGTSSDLGVNLTDLGVLAMSVRISNQTPRAYHFRVNGVVLQTADGERVTALATGDYTSRLDASAASTLQQKLLTDRDIQPSETLTGFLLFPFKAYAQARVVLTDRESGEPEGFSIEF